MVAMRSRSLPHVDARLLRAVAISLTVFALGAISVSLWLSVLVWFFMLLGIAVSLSSFYGEQGRPYRFQMHTNTQQHRPLPPT